MELTRTINADRRYYLDEDYIENADSLLQTFELFNDYKMDMYNRLYEQRFLQKGPLFGETGMSACNYLKQKYHTNDYYNAAIYTAASGQVSAQNEQRRLNKKALISDIENRKKKIQLTKDELAKKLAVKASIRNYAKTGRWVKPYPKCTLKVYKDTIKWYGKEPMPLAEYERSVEKRIRELKHKLAMLQEALKRKVKKIEDYEKYAPRRIVFGTRKSYKEKDSKDIDKLAWANEFYFQRHSSLTFPGRHTSKYGNFLCKYIGSDLHVTCMDGKETVFYDFWPVQYQQEFLANFKADPKERKSVCYNFKLTKDTDGRIY